VDKYLFVGAHPDDIELGAGATLAKAVRSGVECHALVMSDCFESLGKLIDEPKILTQESQRALTLLGVANQNITFLDFPVRNFPERRQEILQQLIEKSRLEKYSRVYVPASSDIHQDHNVVCVESMRAFKFCTILGYELPWNSFQSELRNYNSVDSSQVELKKAALREFQSQVDRFYFTEEKVEITLKYRGLQINSDYAEAFQVLRWIED
jgi:LmbE family N-acetylglucosaminyl deacetylase